MSRGLTVWTAIGVVVVLGAAAFLLTFQSASVAADNTNPTKVRWLLAHQPIGVFDRAITVFADELSRATDGRLLLEIITPEDIGYAQGDVPASAMFDRLDTGRAEIASAYTVPLGRDNQSMWALSLPFIFENYASTGSVLDGEIGDSIRKNYNDGPSSVHALAFTMSGGYRIIASKNTRIQSPSDMKEVRIATSGGPVAEATLTALGAVPVTVDLESRSQAFDANTIDAVETTYSRLAQTLGTQSAYTAYLNETNHSMFLTAIVASKSFYDSLSPADQRALEYAARAAAAIEREDSIALAESVKARLAAEGSVVTVLDEEAHSAFEELAAPVYAQFSASLGETIVRALTERN